MGRSSEEEHEIVIVGGGICGLATALALHRWRNVPEGDIAFLRDTWRPHDGCPMGGQPLCPMRSETLRASGAGIAILANGWRALEQLGVASHLRQTALPIERSQDVGFGKVIPSVTGEARCLKRSDLIVTLADALPPGTIHLGRQIVSVKLDPSNSYPILQLLDGSSIVAKILIGCDGANSVVANFLELKPTKEFGLCSARGLTNYPNGHAFAHEVVRMRRNDILMGRAPIDDKSVYWFTALQLTGEDHAKVSHCPELIRELILHSFDGFPSELMQLIEDSELESLSLTQLRYRAPWDLVLRKFRKGTVTVAGDAMHVMGPFLGQGGSAGLEDAIVLARCLSQKFANTVDNPFTIESKTMTRMMMHRVGEAMDQYLKERRMRVVLLKGMDSIVLERSETLRATGAAIGIQSNGWRALDQLGVGSKLRQTAIPILRFRDVSTDNTTLKERPVGNLEARCLKRSILTETLATDLPVGTIRFGSHITALQMDPTTLQPILHLHDGRVIRAKIVIGCDGVNSVIANYVGLKPPRQSSITNVRAFTNYPNGHGFGPEFVTIKEGNLLLGRIPIDHKLVYWFVARAQTPQEDRTPSVSPGAIETLPSENNRTLDLNDLTISKDAQMIRWSTLESVDRFPREMVEMIEKCDVDSLTLNGTRYRTPWELLNPTFRKGTVTVAGDAMHVMGPFLGQGGSIALEDAVVLARCLARVHRGHDNNGENTGNDSTSIELAIDEYVRQRRTRLVQVSTKTYTLGSLLETSSVFVKLVCIIVMIVFYRDRLGHSRYDCGHL
ncbi:hypothetical protein C3L33_13145, partial [Rhododendron williamsianum]